MDNQNPQPTLVQNNPPVQNNLQNKQQNIQKPETIISQVQDKQNMQQNQGSIVKLQATQNIESIITKPQQSNITQLKQQEKQENTQSNDIIKCICGKLSHYICIERQCQNYAFFCQQGQSTSCKNNLHANCFKISLKTFKEKIQIKLLDTQQLKKWHQNLVQDFLQRVNEQVSKMKQKFQTYAEQTYKFWNLSANQKQVWRKIEQHDIKDLKGEYFWKIIMEMNEEMKQNKKAQSIQEVKQIWNQNWKHLQDNFRQQLLKFQTQITKVNKNLKQVKFTNSFIVSTDQQNKTVHSFFNKKIQKVQLLYKASQNQFKLDKFYQNCIGISNTIIFIETIFQKKVGGFTSLCWKKVEAQQFIEDQQNSSFIFSLSFNKKLNKRKQNESGIWNYKNYGPIFGEKFGVWDIAIQNEANKIDSMIGCNYGFGNSTVRTAETIQQFNGNKNSDQFSKLKEWQVWRITFQS